MAESKNPNRERGLRAAIHNPRVSEEAKQHDRELLASEFGAQQEETPKTGQQQQQSKRRSSASKKSSSTGPHSHAAQGQPASSASAQGAATGAQTGGQSTSRKARRASSGDAGELQQMGETKDRGNV